MPICRVCHRYASEGVYHARCRYKAGAAPPAIPSPSPVYAPGAQPDPVLLPVAARIYVRPPVKHGITGFNPSVCVHRGELLVVVRTYYADKPHSRPVIMRLTASWALEPVCAPEFPPCGPLGIEDVRLFHLPDGRLAGIATTGEYLPRHSISLITFDDDLSIDAVWPMSSPQKNWSPLADRSGRVMFSPKGPVVKLDPAAQRMSVDPAKLVFDGVMRGGSQLVPYEGGFLTVIHEQQLGPVVRYWHRFVHYSRDLRVLRTSDRFYYEAPGIEFCAGLACWQGRWVMSYGVADKEARLVLVPPSTIEDMLAHKREKHEPDRSVRAG